jgi:hypothetical protein
VLETAVLIGWPLITVLGSCFLQERRRRIYAEERLATRQQVISKLDSDLEVLQAEVERGRQTKFQAIADDRLMRKREAELKLREESLRIALQMSAMVKAQEEANRSIRTLTAKFDAAVEAVRQERELDEPVEIDQSEQLVRRATLEEIKRVLLDQGDLSFEITAEGEARLVQPFEPITFFASQEAVEGLAGGSISAASLAEEIWDAPLKPLTLKPDYTFSSGGGTFGSFTIKIDGSIEASPGQVTVPKVAMLPLPRGRRLSRSEDRC